MFGNRKGNSLALTTDGFQNGGGRDRFPGPRDDAYRRRSSSSTSRDRDRAKKNTNISSNAFTYESRGVNGH